MLQDQLDDSYQNLCNASKTAEDSFAAAVVLNVLDLIFLAKDWTSKAYSVSDFGFEAQVTEMIVQNDPIAVSS